MVAGSDEKLVNVEERRSGDCWPCSEWIENVESEGWTERIWGVRQH